MRKNLGKTRTSGKYSPDQPRLVGGIFTSKDLFWAIAFLTISIFNTVYASEEIPFFWEGKITVTQIIHSEHGDVTTTWNLKPKWKETDRIDVKDEKGRLVGQFVKVDDCGSAWSSEGGGIVHIDGSNGYIEHVYSGKGRGSGVVITWGWIYYSLSDNDPLKELLPNGFYSLEAASGMTQKYEGVKTTTDVKFVPPDTRVSSSRWPVSLSYKINGAYYYQPFGGSASNPMPVEGVKYCITNPAQAQMPRAWDMEMRVITDGTMSGSCQTEWAEGGVTNKVSWNISKRLDINVTLYKADKSWRPKSVYVENSNIKIKAEIDKYKELEGKFQFTLYDVSKEKGYCMNDGDSTDLDMKFFHNPEYDTPQETEDIIESTKAMNSTDVNVWTSDYGAWGRLKAKVNVEGEWYECKSEDGKSYITIPYDDNENHIADYWEEEKGVSDESADTDNDQEPDGVGREPGDGFTNYEEYRGFVVNAVWTDTLPTRKDIFIYDEKGAGIGAFSNLGLHVHLIDQTEYDEDRVVNFNRGYAALGEQKGLYLREEDLATGIAGEVRPCIGSPNVVDEVVIDISGNSTAIAHELGHAVNIIHHGFDWKDPTGMVAQRGGKWSGDIACVMRYEPTLFYLGIDGKLYEYPKNEGGVSCINYCSAKNGTGINAPPERIEEGKPYPVAGDATIGECRKNVTLKGEDRWGGD